VGIRTRYATLPSLVLISSKTLRTKIPQEEAAMISLIQLPFGHNAGDTAFVKDRVENIALKAGVVRDRLWGAE
jgi:hypothetical protein